MNLNFAYIVEDTEAEIELVDAKPKPECPPPVWDERPIRAEDCWRATLIACGARG